MTARPLGMNARNALILRHNPRAAIVAARDKVGTKQALELAGIAVPPTIALATDARELATLDPDRWGPTWVMKPGTGSKGSGVLVNSGGTDAVSAQRHAERIFRGDFSAHGDSVLVERLVRPDPRIDLGPVGLPDVRVICLLGNPVLAMLRVPTVASRGRGNLHQGGIGVAVDLTTGRLERAVLGGGSIDVHPDSGVRLVDRVVPAWKAVLDAASRSGPATGLGYVGVDLVVDAELGPLVLEVNAHPGLEIQNICGRPIPIGGIDTTARRTRRSRLGRRSDPQRD